MGWFSSSPAPEQKKAEAATSLDGTYTPMKRNERKACWEARDAYFKCLDKNNILDAVKDADAALKNCPTENAKYEQDCATSWVCRQPPTLTRHDEHVLTVA